jgi:hypothetical protein
MKRLKKWLRIVCFFLKHKEKPVYDSQLIHVASCARCGKIWKGPART